MLEEHFINIKLAVKFFAIKVVEVNADKGFLHASSHFRLTLKYSDLEMNYSKG